MALLAHGNTCTAVGVDVPMLHEPSPKLRLSGWMMRLGWLGLTVINPLFVLAAAASWSRHVLFAHCDWCESQAWNDLCSNAGHILVVLLILGFGFVRSVLHLKAAKSLLIGDPRMRRRRVLTYAAVGVLHTLAVSVSLRHSTALLLAGLLAWPIALLVMLRRHNLLWGEPPLPAVRIV